MSALDDILGKPPEEITTLEWAVILHNPPAKAEEAAEELASMRASRDVVVAAHTYVLATANWRSRLDPITRKAYDELVSALARLEGEK